MNRPPRPRRPKNPFSRGGMSYRPGAWRPPSLRTILLALALIVGAMVARFLESGPLTPGVADVSGPARLVDGDSLFIGSREVRLDGIDAPEGPQTCRRDGREWDCGEEARRHLARLIGGRNIDCEAVKEDQHGRLLALCRAGDVELNREMVAAGFALSYGRFKDAERQAREAKKGLWSGEFQRPRDWRRERGIGG